MSTRDEGGRVGVVGASRGGIVCGAAQVWVAESQGTVDSIWKAYQILAPCVHYD